MRGPTPTSTVPVHPWFSDRVRVRFQNHQRFAGDKVKSILQDGNAERATQVSGTTRELSVVVDAPMHLHLLQTPQRLQGSYQHGAADPSAFGDDVQAKLGVNRVDIQRATLRKHRTATIRQPERE